MYSHLYSACKRENQETINHYFYDLCKMIKDDSIEIIDYSSIASPRADFIPLDNQYMVPTLDYKLSTNEQILLSLRKNKMCSLVDVVETMEKEKCMLNVFNALMRGVQDSEGNLKFRYEYEKSFQYYMHKNSITRIRYTLLIGLVVLMIKYTFGYVSDTEGRITDGNFGTSVLYLHFGVSIPVVFLAVLATLYEKWNKYCEIYTSFAFLVVTITLTIEKVLEQHQGPVLSLFLMFIPIFGIIRIRFIAALILSICMFTVYMIGVLSSSYTFDENSGLGSREDGEQIAYQGFNYAAVIIGGAVSLYRQQILRRRNYVLHLPFTGWFNPHYIYCQMKRPEYKKQSLLDRKTLQFKSNQVEDMFCRFWYLLDSFPFESIHKVKLHTKVYKTIRFAVGSVIFGQIVLAFQDVLFLRVPTLSQHVYRNAVILRFGVVIPSYVVAILCMHYYGHQYYYAWKGYETKTKIHIDHHIARASSFQKKHHTTSSGTCRSRSTSMNTDYESPRKSPLTKPNFRMPSYVSKMQIISAMIVYLHGMSMGAILLWYSRDFEAQASIAPCYFLGLLNALLFPHRSGFRVRFKYAAFASLCLWVAFTILCITVNTEKVPEYSSYTIITILLGMMISYEEESLRRAFFVRRAIRINEFKVWYIAVRTIKPNLLKYIAKYRNDNGKTSRKFRKVQADNNPLTYASKYGMYVEALKAFVSGIIYGA